MRMTWRSLPFLDHSLRGTEDRRQQANEQPSVLLPKEFVWEVLDEGRALHNVCGFPARDVTDQGGTRVNDGMQAGE